MTEIDGMVHAQATLRPTGGFHFFSVPDVLTQPRPVRAVYLNPAEQVFTRIRLHKRSVWQDYDDPKRPVYTNCRTCTRPIHIEDGPYCPEHLAAHQAKRRAQRKVTKMGMAA